MRAVIQRVSEVSVTWDGGRGAIGRGLLILLGVAKGDDADGARWLARKCAGLRIFGDAEGRMDRSLLDVEGHALVVSQFTLHGDCRKGRRPSFDQAMPPGEAEPLYEAFVAYLREEGVPVETGAFGAMMQVALVNDGPVTLVVDAPASSTRAGAERA